MLPDSSFPVQVRTIAESFFLKGQYLCSEAVLRAIIDVAQMPEHRDDVALASGFATGMGGAGCSCGAVCGGIMGLGLFFGRTLPGDASVRHCMALAHELHDTFRAKHHSICCRVLNKGLVHLSDEQQRHCAERTGDAAEMTAILIMRELEKREKK